MKKIAHITGLVLVGITVLASCTFATLILLRESAYYFNSDSRFSTTMFAATFVGVLLLIGFVVIWLQQNTPIFTSQNQTSRFDSYSIDDLAKELELFRRKWPEWTPNKRAKILSNLEDLIFFKIRHNQDKAFYALVYDMYTDLSEFSTPDTIALFVEDVLVCFSRYRLNIALPRSEW